MEREGQPGLIPDLWLVVGFDRSKSNGILLAKIRKGRGTFLDKYPGCYLVLYAKKN
jgi:hypothetical protein